LLVVCWDLKNKRDVGWRNWAGLLAALVIGLWYPLATLSEPSVAVASALRWITALVLFLACVLLSLWISRVDRSREPSAGLSFALFDEIFNVFSVFTFLPWALMGTIVTVSVLMQLAQIPMIGGLGTGFIWGCTLVMALAALAMVVMRNWLAANDSAATSHSVMGSTLWTIAAPTLLLSPLLAWTLLNVAVTVISHPLTGPDPDSMFAKMGLAISYATPILLIAIGLVMVAVSRPSPRLAFIAALFLMTSMVAGTCAANRDLDRTLCHAVCDGFALRIGLANHRCERLPRRLAVALARVSHPRNPTPLANGIEPNQRGFCHSGALSDLSIGVDAQDRLAWNGMGFCGGFDRDPSAFCTSSLSLRETSLRTLDRCCRDRWDGDRFTQFHRSFMGIWI
jgi:hypothetical protein